MNSISLPTSYELPINTLSSVFAPSGTTTSYKFFWFLSILDIIERRNPISENKVVDTPLLIDISEILLNMVIDAWFPLYCKLNLGNQDRLFKVRDGIIEAYNKTVSSEFADNGNSCNLEDKDKEELLTEIKKIAPEKIIKLTKNLKKYVPYRFLSPWCNEENNNIVMQKTQKEPELKFIYSFVDDKTIQIDPSWSKYLTDNLKILRDYTYWNLCCYIQRRNPNAHFVIDKINRVNERKPHDTQKNIWNLALKHGCEFKCPYSPSDNNIIIIGNYELDHFIPWNYICNNLMWNLTPAKKEANRSKGDKLPNIETCIKTFALNQRTLLQYLVNVYGEKPEDYNYGQEKCPNIIYDYLSLGVSITEIANKNDAQIVRFFKKHLNPYYLQAKNMGFKTWNNKYIGNI